MEIQAAIPPTLPRINPTISGWQVPPDSIADHRSTAELPGSADVVIIGSGISGASIGFDLLTRDGNLKVVMLEARQVCSGATGRNGGHTKAASYRSFLDNFEALGADEAIKIARLEYDNIIAVHTFSREHNFDCDLFSGDTVDIIYDNGQWNDAVKSIELMRKLMPDDLQGAAKYTFHTSDEARTKFYCNGDKPIGAISYKAGSLIPYKFVIGVLKFCLEKGLNLQVNTPAISLAKNEDGDWTVKTDRGITIAKRVVLATNGYTSYLVQNLRSIIVPLRGQITAHRPGSNMPKEGLPTTYSFIYSNGYEYMISRPLSSEYARDIIIGGGLAKASEEGLYEYGTTDDTTLNPEVSSYLAKIAPRYFGDSWGRDHPDGRIRMEWSGIMGYTSDGYPFVGEMPNKKGLWISAGFQGHGMVLCFMCAKALVMTMCGDDKDDNLVWFPNAFRVTEERTRKKFRGKPQLGSREDSASLASNLTPET